MSEEPKPLDHNVEPYGGTNVQVSQSPDHLKISILQQSLAAEDKLLEKHNLRRDNIVDQLIALGVT